MAHFQPREIDVRDLRGYVQWALEHVQNARAVAEDIEQPQAIKDALEEAEKQLTIVDMEAKA